MQKGSYKLLNSIAHRTISLSASNTHRDRKNILLTPCEVLLRTNGGDIGQLER